MNDDPISVREATPADLPQLHATIAAVFSEVSTRKPSGEELWQWEYASPEQPASVILAVSGDTIGGYTHLPFKRVRLGDSIVTTTLIQDVGTAAAFRGKGLFPRLGAYLLEQARSHGHAFAWGWPNDRALPGWIRYHQFEVIRHVPIYLRLLDPGRAIGDRLGRPGLGSALSLPDWLGRSRRDPAPLSFEPIERFDAAIERVTTEFASEVRVAVVRDATYLNWRFTDRPASPYTAWLARLGDEPVAYLVTRRAQLFGMDCLLIMDLGCTRSHERSLLRLLGWRHGEERRTGAALALTMGLHSFFRRLPARGYIPLPDRLNPHPFRLMLKPLTPAAEEVAMEPDNWLITFSDYDVLRVTTGRTRDAASRRS